MSYARDTVRGVTWIGLFRIVIGGVSFIRTIFLARLLDANQFGVFGVVILTMSLLEILTETGVNTVLVQLKNSADSYINSAWIVSIGRGIVISAVMILGAPYVATFFKIPESLNLIILASMIPLIRGFINPSEVNFQKNLLFKSEFFFRTGIFLIDALVSVVLTIITKNPMSLVWGILAGAIAEMILSHLSLSPKPKLSFEWAKVKYILHRGKWMTATGIVDYFIQNGDNLVVGRILGATQLGFYQMAYQISTRPIAESSNILSKVFFPVLVKISDGGKSMKKAYFKMTAVLTIVVGIGAILIIAFGNLFVEVFLGKQWMTIVQTLQILAVFTLIRSIVLSSYALLLADKRQERVTIISLTGFAVMFLSIFPLINMYGINGAALATVFGAIASLLPVVYFVAKS